MMRDRLATLPAWPLLQQVIQIAANRQAEIVLVGGPVRDVLLGKTTILDWDWMVLQGDTAELARLLADTLDAHWVPLDEAFGVYRVVVPATGDSGLPELTLDFAKALNGSLMDDLHRRDITINAMAWEPATDILHDLLGGQNDLTAGRIRMVSEANLTDDPLRLLRVFRFNAQIPDSRIDDETLACITRHNAQIWTVAAERIQVEFLKLLGADHSFSVLRQMADCGFLEALLPELKPMRAIPPNGHHHLPLFDHTLELVNQAEALIHTMPSLVQERMQESVTGHYQRVALLKLACLLHDIAKPATIGVREDGRLTYYGHDTEGERLTKAFCQKWKFSLEFTGYLTRLVRWHLYPCQFGPDSPRKSILRLFRKLGDETPDTVFLALADRFSTRGEGITDAILEKSYKEHMWLIKQYTAEQAVLRLPRLLDGHAIMQLLDIPPGPEIKVLMAALEEAQQLGEVSTRQEAEVWLGQNHSLIRADTCVLESEYPPDAGVGPRQTPID